MRTFPALVEQWRGTVKTAIADIFDKDPSKKSLIDALGSTIDDLADVILAIIQAESSGNANATGDNGNSIGLMQLNYGAGTPQGAGFTGTAQDLFMPYINIYYGVKVFLGQLDRYRDYDQAILAYNAGSVRTTSAGIPVNLDYLQKVLSYLTEKKISFLPEFWRTWYTDIIASRSGSKDPTDPGSTIVGGSAGDVIAVKPASSPGIPISDTDHSTRDLAGVPAPGPPPLWIRFLTYLYRKIYS